LTTATSTEGAGGGPRTTQEMTDVGDNRVRLLHDGAAAFPAMLGAISAARREVLLEFYWFGADRIGALFRDALVERARAGVQVRVLFDAVGSLETPASFFRPLIDAGAQVIEFGPISPWKRRFRLWRLRFRDHRKILVVDGVAGFAGGINIGDLWAPSTGHGRAFRDDAVELRGPAAASIREAFIQVWKRCGGEDIFDGGVLVAVPDPLVRVLTNRIEGLPDRSIRRLYLDGLRRAITSIDIASAYFLPGPLFLDALRSAAKRGVRVRVLVPERSDVWLASLAMDSLLGRLLADGVEVYAYTARILHSKTATFDGRFTIVGSHNLDTISLRFNLECNVIIDSAVVAAMARRAFEHDLEDARSLDLTTWKGRSRTLRVLAWCAALLRAIL
jgi:cardiolipin synthase